MQSGLGYYANDGGGCLARELGRASSTRSCENESLNDSPKYSSPTPSQQQPQQKQPQGTSHQRTRTRTHTHAHTHTHTHTPGLIQRFIVHSRAFRSAAEVLRLAEIGVCVCQSVSQSVSQFAGARPMGTGMSQTHDAKKPRPSSWRRRMAARWENGFSSRFD